MIRTFGCTVMAVILTAVSNLHEAEAITIRFVNPSASGANNGTTWADAYTDLQSALVDSALGSLDQIWVAAGTYYPSVRTNPSLARTESFVLRDGVWMYGGFDGSESSLEDRDWETNPTILSGDIGTTSDSSDNCYHVVTANGVSDLTLLDGFTITGGYADTSASGRRGAGLYIVEKDNPHPVPDDPSSPRVFNCKFVGNVARSATGAIGVGGAVYSSPSSTTNTLVFTNCAFLDNQTALSGGAVYLANMNAASFSSCEFIGNSTTRLPTSGAGTHGGGGLYVSGNSSQVVTLIDSVFRHNSTSAGEECGRESFTDAGGGV